MGLFSSKNTTKSSLEIPEWMQGMPEGIANQVMELMGRENLTPEQRVAGFDPAQETGINQMINFGSESGPGGQLLSQFMSGSESMGQGFDILTALGLDPSKNEGINMENVMSYIDNDILGGQIDAASRDVVRNFSEVDAPRSRMMQALSGGTGSTRGAIGDAILQRGAEDRVGDISSMMRGDAFRTALGLGANEASQNAALDFNSRMGAGSSLMTGGMNAGTLANSIGLSNINTMMAGGGMNQAMEQALKNIDQENLMLDWMKTQQASGIINPMAGQFGTKKQTTKSKPSIAQLGLSAASAFMGMPGGGFGGGGGGPSGFFNSSSNFLDPTAGFNIQDMFPDIDMNLLPTS